MRQVAQLFVVNAYREPLKQVGSLMVRGARVGLGIRSSSIRFDAERDPIGTSGVAHVSTKGFQRDRAEAGPYVCANLRSTCRLAAAAIWNEQICLQ